MAATSVTGVGHGSVEGHNAGSKHTTFGVARLLGPRVMAADAATLTSGAASIVLPLLSGVVGDYIVLVSDATGAAACSGSIAFGANGTTLTLAGTGSHVIHWAIVRTGLTT